MKLWDPKTHFKTQIKSRKLMSRSAHNKTCLEIVKKRTKICLKSSRQRMWPSLSKKLISKKEIPELKKWKGLWKIVGTINLCLGNKLRQSQRDKNKELSKIRNELMLVKSQTSAKDKTQVDDMLKTQNDIQKGNWPFSIHRSNQQQEHGNNFAQKWQEEVEF